MTNKIQQRDYCLSCLRAKKNCYCRYINPFQTNTHFVILMHPKEAYQQKTGTGRLSHIALNNSEIIVGVDFTNNKRVNDIINDKTRFSMMLYPDKKSINISKNELQTEILNDRQLNILIIDSTWYYSKKIIRLSKNLQTVPTISFNTTKKSAFKFKKQPNEHYLSTIEAIYYFLEECDKTGIENVSTKKKTLLAVFNRMVNFQLECEFDPNVKKRNYQKIAP